MTWSKRATREEGKASCVVIYSEAAIQELRNRMVSSLGSKLVENTPSKSHQSQGPLPAAKRLYERFKMEGKVSQLA